MGIILSGTVPNDLGIVQPPHVREDVWVVQVLWVEGFGGRRRGNTWKIVLCFVVWNRSISDGEKLNATNKKRL